MTITRDDIAKAICCPHGCMLPTQCMRAHSGYTATTNAVMALIEADPGEPPSEPKPEPLTPAHPAHTLTGEGLDSFGRMMWQTMRRLIPLEEGDEQPPFAPTGFKLESDAVFRERLLQAMQADSKAVDATRPRSFVWVENRCGDPVPQIVYDDPRVGCGDPRILKELKLEPGDVRTIAQLVEAFPHG